jgi:hypothetical protein
MKLVADIVDEFSEDMHWGRIGVGHRKVAALVIQ